MTKAFIVAGQTDFVEKHQHKAYADARQRAIFSPVKEGDKVLLQQPSLDKLSMQYDPQQHTVLAQKGSSVALQQGTEAGILRNVSRVRKLFEVDGNSCNNDLFLVARAQIPENQLATCVEHQPQRLRQTPNMSRLCSYKPQDLSHVDAFIHIFHKA